MNKPHESDGFLYAVEGFEEGMDDCPMFTNCTRTVFEAKRIESMWKKQGLLVAIRPIADMKGLNPRYEHDTVKPGGLH